MLTYTFTGDNIAITDAAREYVEKRFKAFDRFADKTENLREMQVTVTKTTAHERHGAFRVEVKFRIHTRDFFAAGEADDVFAAVDVAKDELMREVTRSNQKRRTLFHRGSRAIKNLMKGLRGK